MLAADSRLPVLRVSVLGTVSVQGVERPPVAIGSLQQKTLLTLLVAAKGRSVGLDTLADELWPEERPGRWRGCLATLANSLRRAAGDADFVFSTDRGYALHRRPDGVETDVDELHDCLERARAAEAEGLGDVAETAARRALTIYGNGPWTSDYWGWNEAAAEAARILATALIRRGAYVACITELSGVIVDFDWHDALWACLIYAHAQLGSVRRARDLAQQAKGAVGAVTPLLTRVERHLAAPPASNAALLFAASA